MERLSSFQCGDLSFSSDYDSGNASRVEQVDEHEFARLGRLLLLVHQCTPFGHPLVGSGR